MSVKSSRSANLIKNTSILAFGTACTKGIMFIMTPLYTRWLTAADYGTFDLLMTYISLGVPFLTLSIGEGMFRFLLDADHEYRQKIASTSFLVYGTGALAVLVFVALWSIFGSSNKVLVLSVTLYLFTEIAYNYLTTILRGYKQLSKFAIANILFVVSLAFGTFLFVLIIDLGLPGMFLGYALGDAVANIFMFCTSTVRKDISLRTCDSGLLKELLLYSLPLMPQSISWWIVNVSDRTVITALLGASDNAVYAVACKIPNLCTTFFNVFNTSWQQSATEALSDDDRDRFYNGVMNRLLITIGSVCILIMGWSYWIFKLLFSEAYFEGYLYSQILVIGLFFSMAAQFIGGIYVALKMPKINGFTTVVAAVVNIVLCITLMRMVGLIAASIATLISYVVFFAIRFIDIRKRIHLHMKRKVVLIISIMTLIMLCSNMMNNYYALILNLLSLILFMILNKDVLHKIFRVRKTG